MSVQNQNGLDIFESLKMLEIPSILSNPSTCHHCSFSPFCQKANMSLVTLKKSLNRKELLYKYHTPFYYIYIISSGILKTSHVSIDGQERIQQFYFTGEILGFDAIYSENYPFSAVSLTSSQVCQIPYPQLLTFLTEDPSLNSQFLSLISQRFHFGSYLIFSSAEQRVACFLLELIKRLHVNAKELEFKLSISRQDIGHYLGLASETISRVFTRFQQNQLLWTRHKTIKILNLSALERIAQNGLATMIHEPLQGEDSSMKR